MKKLLTILLFIAIIASNSYSQNTPVAVNDTFYIYYEGSKYISKGLLTLNDNDIDGDLLIIDTVIYNGNAQVVQSYYQGSIAYLRFKNLTYTSQNGFFGLDSLTYILTDMGNPTGFDTARVYLYVMRKEYEYLDINNISANINNVSLFNNSFIGSPTIADFNVPKQNSPSDPKYSTIYEANLWVGGEDPNGQVKIYAPTGSRVNLTPPIIEYIDGDAGPISDEYDFYSYQWDRVWKVSQTEIDAHIAWANNPSAYPTYVIPEAIQSWPGNGAGNGQASQLAPFYDIDNNGMYDPYVGDYPIIKGQQAVYFIKNDLRSNHLHQNQTPIGIELHGMAYAYDCPSDSAINNTIFLNYKIYNRSQYSLNNAYAGMWVDFDLGNFADDYIGCDVARGAFYAYNGDNDDEGSYGYGANPPAQGVVFLKGPQADNDLMDNPFTTNIQNAIDSSGIPYAGLGVGYGDGIVDNEHLGMSNFIYYQNNYPGNEKYNQLQGLNSDGTPMVSQDSVPFKYIFPGDSDPLFWGTNGIASTGPNEISMGNTPADRRGLGSVGPFTMQPGEMKELELAFVFGRDYQNPNNTAAIVVMQERIDSIRSYYLDGFQSVCGGTLATNVNKSEVLEDSELMVYPNPFQNQFMVKYELKNKTTQLHVYNIYGKLISSKVLTQANSLIDLSGEASGIYFVQILDGDKRLTQKVMMK